MDLELELRLGGMPRPRGFVGIILELLTRLPSNENHSVLPSENHMI